MNKLKKSRETKEFTQHEVADLIHVSQQQYQKYESGVCSPDLVTAYNLAVLFGLTIEDLFCLKN